VYHPYETVETEVESEQPLWTVNEAPATTEPPGSEPKKAFPSLVPVGQVHGTYIVAQNEDGFFMIDQHAAQERIKYEFFREKLAKPDHEERQLLLLPMMFHYSADDK